MNKVNDKTYKSQSIVHELQSPFFQTVQTVGHCSIVSPEHRCCENKDYPTYERCMKCSLWIECTPV